MPVTSSKQLLKNEADEPKTSTSNGEQLDCIKKKERIYVDLGVKRSRDKNKNTSKPKNELETEQIRQFCNMVCDLCAVNFESFSDAFKHYRDCHSIKGYLMCCNQKFCRRGQVVEHVQVHLNPNTFQCVTMYLNFEFISLSTVVVLDALFATNRVKPRDCYNITWTRTSPRTRNHFIVSNVPKSTRVLSY